ncbi:DNA topology modulation protein FlaR [Leuconostoc gasicomitatum]|uniref:DNA topology modulation protein FlaR n=1 Tax=Leuconostoc gelidum group TaxID=3016637 RepID=UPI0007E092CA|nr:MULTISPECIES: DNA topology modulation protein FlaR [Leuconostoc gelidum group]MBZ5944091.1 DNA topology modulation protein FlaR [Leuconostoc gasicomitatum]MBZ5946199.1 DNA topology modulation protein FlaR [Leuconostoc gasicomitatum]MBZ5949612.1 DNA topology modulation protein FlaR [Leuconostoc gasicomitatum]MBZ5950647.1 DNA topology modulation protein FlaR [Leuconostoc gasicomitatum]MBZ5968451.1 DNA topology modulation protein FlaR [Leuconostoc gasicomitatum]
MKIRIIGPVGSGKTTFAHKIARIKPYPVTSLDDLNWVRQATGDRHRTPSERQALLQVIIQQNDWIIEGAQFREGQDCFALADVIYVLDLPYYKNVYYILKRWFNNRLHGGPKQYRNLWLFLKWQNKWRTNNRDDVYRLLKPYHKKVIIIRKNKV